MKPIPLLIAVSLAGNAALLAFLFVAAPGNSSSSSASSVTNPATAKLARSPGPAKSGVTANVDPKLWQKVGDADFAAQIKRLHAAGFPPSVIRAIIAAQISDRFAAQRKALNPPPSAHDFWKNDQPTDPKIRAALRDLSAQQTRMMADLLGPDPDPNPMQSVYERRLYAGLPPAKIDQLTRVRRDYDEMRSEALSGFAGGTLLPEDRAKLALLDKEQRADFASILSPQELEDYDLRNSNTANQMRYQLSAFNPNEAEFRAIYQLQHAFDEQYSNADLRTMLQAGGALPQDVMRQRADAQKQLAAQIKAALGPERGAEYERAIDYNFQAINRVVDRLNLPKAAATEVWTLQKDMEQRVRAVQTNRELSPEARNAQLTALSTEATTKLTTSLGQRGLDIYKQNGGFWLQNLQPRPVGAPGGGGGGTITTRVLTAPGG